MWLVKIKHTMHMNNQLDNLIKERAPIVYKTSVTSKLLRKILKKLFKYEETAQTIKEISNLHYSGIFKLLGEKYTPNITITGLNRIPKEGAALIVANHPMGPAYVIALISKLNAIRKDTYIFANKLFIDLIPPFNECMAPLYWDTKKQIHSASKTTLTNMLSFLNKGMIGIYFPSGRIAKYRLTKTTDYPWHDTPLIISSRYGLKIIPVYIDSKNSLIFYFARSINKYLRDLSQIYELINKKNKHIKINIGTQIDREELNQDNKIAIKELRKIVENLR